MGTPNRRSKGPDRCLGSGVPVPGAQFGEVVACPVCRLRLTARGGARMPGHLRAERSAPQAVGSAGGGATSR